MADIQQYLDAIADAEKGEDVRWSIHDGIKAINDDVVAFESSVDTKIATIESTASQAVTDAQNASTAAQNSANSAQAAANTAEQMASDIAGTTWIGEIFLKPTNMNGFNSDRSLGTKVTTEQLEMIAAGDFSDLHVGDYWTGENSHYGNARIAHLDYKLNLEKHHAVIIFDDVFVWNGSYGWKYYTDQTDQKNANLGCSVFVEENNHVTNIGNDFGIPSDHIESVSETIPSDSMNSNAYTDKACKIQIPSMVQLLGICVNDLFISDSIDQLALFKNDLRMIKINMNIYYWLKEVSWYDNATFPYIVSSNNGRITRTNWKSLCGYRIMFILV